jgi:hypothetical protein
MNEAHEQWGRPPTGCISFSSCVVVTVARVEQLLSVITMFYRENSRVMKWRPSASRLLRCEAERGATAELKFAADRRA